MRPGENRGAWKECLALLPPGPDAVRTLPPPRPGDGTNQKRKPRRLAACRRGCAMEGAASSEMPSHAVSCTERRIPELRADSSTRTIPRRREPTRPLPLMGEATGATRSHSALGWTICGARVRTFAQEGKGKWRNRSFGSEGLRSSCSWCSWRSLEVLRARRLPRCSTTRASSPAGPRNDLRVGRGPPRPQPLSRQHPRDPITRP